MNENGGDRMNASSCQYTEIRLAIPADPGVSDVSAAQAIVQWRQIHSLELQCNAVQAKRALIERNLAYNAVTGHVGLARQFHTLLCDK